MAESNLHLLRERIAHWSAQLDTWRWAPDNPISKLHNQDPNLFYDLLSAYEQGTQQERSQIRTMIAEMQVGDSLLAGAIVGATKRLEETKDPRWLHEALVAFSILDSHDDPLDVKDLAETLYVTAVRCGIDPQPYFDVAAAMSSSEPLDQWRDSTRDLLASFH